VAANCMASSGTRTVRYVVHSGDRDRSLHPHAHTFELALTHEVRDILSVHLVGMDFPFVNPTVTQANRALVVEDGGAGGLQQVITVPVGTYLSTDDLAEALQNALNNSVSAGGGSWECTVQEAGGGGGQARLVVDRVPNAGALLPLSFSIRAVGPQSGRLWGLNNEDQNDVSSSVPAEGNRQRLRATAAMDPLAHVRTAVLTIPDFEVIVSNRDAIHGAFALLTPAEVSPSSSSLSTVVVRPRQSALASKEFMPALWTLRRLGVMVRDVDGQPYDTQGLDFWLMLDLEVLCRRHL